jgi:Ser/Thr protein kinase RdoA (MazF antagonist)
LPPSEREPFREVAEQFKRLAAKLVVGPQVFGLIHGDFTFDNVLLYRRDLRIIDFDDCGFGYFLYDIATLLDRIEWREDYPSLRAALIEGYRKECSFSSGHERLLDLFLLVRWTFLGLTFLSAPEYATGRAYAPRFLKIVVPKMRKYLQNL